MHSISTVSSAVRLDSCAMTPDAFTTSLERSAGKHPPSKARRIAALLPQIEAAMAQGRTRAHVVTALMDVGIEVTAQQLSNVLARLRRQRQKGSVLPGARPALSPAPPVPSIASVPTLSPERSVAPVAVPSKFGTHDPRLLDEVMRSTPDMKALAKLAPKHPNPGNQGKP